MFLTESDFYNVGVFSYQGLCSQKTLGLKNRFTKDRVRKRINAVLVESVLKKINKLNSLNEWVHSKELEILHCLPEKEQAQTTFWSKLIEKFFVLSTNSFVCPLELVRIWWLVFLSEIYLKYCGFSVEIKINILSSIKTLHSQRCLWNTQKHTDTSPTIKHLLKTLNNSCVFLSFSLKIAYDKVFGFFIITWFILSLMCHLFCYCDLLELHPSNAATQKW